MRKTGAPVKRQRRGRVSRTCELASCGKTFETVQSQIDRGNGRYCTRACYGRAMRTPLDQEGRECTRCKTWKLAEAFGENPQRPGRLRPHCDPCRRKYERDRKARDPEAATRKRLVLTLAQYGMTIEDYERKVVEQGGVCWICGTDPLAAGLRRLVPDHDHVTGRARGLLCDACNTALGLLRDSTTRLASAIRYLDHPWGS